jgi:hypothetical protein
LQADLLCGKWKRAKKGVSMTQSAFDQLINSLDPVLIEEWTNQERVTMEKRGDHLNIYNVATDKCWKLVYSAFGIVR